MLSAMSSSEDGSFRRLSREVLVDNPWHRYCLDRYTQADGSEGRYYYVDMPGSCGIVPLFADGSTLLVRVYRYLLGSWLWEFPIGHEGRRGSCRRCPQGAARGDRLRGAGDAAHRQLLAVQGVSNERCHFFLARGLEEVGQDLEASERIEVHRMPWDEARERLLAQELGDGQSMSGLLLYERWLARAEEAGS